MFLNDALLQTKNTFSSLTPSRSNVNSLNYSVYALKLTHSSLTHPSRYESKRLCDTL